MVEKRVIGNATRPLVRYHGGKWKLAPWILQHFPDHRVYVEPFGGGGSVLLRKPRSYAEVYNDLDGEIVNLFQVTRDRAEEFVRSLELTPFARSEFLGSYKPSGDPLEQARRTVARAFMGFGSAAVCGEMSGFRSNSNRSGTTPAHDWRNYPSVLPAVIERLRGVVIEQLDAMLVMERHDGPETLHYCDPPYVHSTRGTRRGHGAYKFEMSDAAHVNFAETARGLQGSVVVSGYPCPLYDLDLFADWRRVECAHMADGASPRTEVLWLNRMCSERIENAQRQVRMEFA